MTKHTNKLLVTFEHPEILQQFNNFFIEKYGTVRGYRVQIIEEMITEFNRSQTIQKFEPEYLKKIEHLRIQLQQQTKEKNVLAAEVEQLTRENQKNLNQINNLNQLLEQYQSLKAENTKLLETIKNNQIHIDDLTKKHDELSAKYEETLIKHNEYIKDLNKEYNNNLKQKEEKNEALTGVIIKLKDDIHNIKEMNVVQRIFKRYPEEKIIELKQP